MIGQARGEARRRPANEPASFFLSLSLTAARPCGARYRLALMRSSVSGSNRCLGSSRWREIAVLELVALIAHGLTVPIIVGERMGVLGHRHLPGRSMIERQEPGGATAQNRRPPISASGSFRCARSQCNDTSSARTLGCAAPRGSTSSSCRTSCTAVRPLGNSHRSESVGRLAASSPHASGDTQRNQHDDSISFGTDLDRAIAHYFNMVPIGSKSGRRRELQARWPTKTSPFSNGSPAFSAVPRGSQRNRRLTIAVMMKRMTAKGSW